MTIKKLAKNNPYPWDLLLLADPSRELIAEYLESSQVACYYNEVSIPLGVIVWQTKTKATVEIMNVAVAEDSQGLGIGTQLLEFVLNELKRAGSVKEVFVKTGSTSYQALALYQKVGFVLKAREQDYFIKHYPEPIFENGEQLRDQLTLHLIIK